MKKFIMSMTGAGITLASAAILWHYGAQKSANKDPHPTKLAAGIVGSLAGMALAALSEINIPSKKDAELELGDLLDDEALFLMDENICEVLGESDEHLSRPALRHIELDEEASIDDFI